jgi:hypothetical protein
MQIAGAYRLGPESGRLLVHTTRTGLGAKAGHDLTIEVTRWHGRATVDPATPADALVAVEVEVESLEVREGTGGVKALTEADRAEIRRPSARYSTPPSTQSSPSGPGGSRGRRRRSPSTAS